MTEENTQPQVSGELTLAAAAESELSNSVSETNMRVSHFWFCAGPVFSTQLIFFPIARESVPSFSILEFYDSDGSLLNTARVAFSGKSVGVVDTDAMLSACKRESGFKHGHVVIKSPVGIGHECRLISPDMGGLGQGLREISRRRYVFFPSVFAPERNSYVALVNFSQEETTVRLRVFCGSRTPKVEIKIPPFGSKILSIEQQFPEYLYGEDGKRLPAYVRLGIPDGSGSAGVFFFERNTISDSVEAFRAVG